MVKGITYRVGVDIGGTFTDIALLASDGTILSHKLPSTPDDYSRGIAEGLTEILDVHGISPDSVEVIVHATTVATNTILEYKGAKTGLVTTLGFRDVLEMRRLRIPVIYDLHYKKPRPLALRRHRFELDERMDFQGQVLRAFNDEDVEDIARALKKVEIDSVAICLLHSYANPAHEKRVADILTRILGPDVYVSSSSDVLPEIREYERTSTTVVNAYIGPVVGRYLKSLSERISAIGLKCPIQIMHSAGGIMSIASAIKKPAHLVESGPAAGVIAGARIAAAMNYQKVISFDMGGTTAKAALIEDGQPARTAEFEVGSGINLSSKLVKGGGYAVKLPFIDVSEIGAGGGSIISVSGDGRVSVGPQSAGARPGPVAYGHGGTEPTLTDVFIELGFINPDSLVGGEFLLDKKASHSALKAKVADPMAMGTEEAAYGILTLAVATMTRAIKAVSTYQGRDPREFSLIAFGGNGPVVAAEVARALQMSEVLVPPAAGVLSAMGLLFSDVEHEFVQTVLGRWEEITEEHLVATYDALAAEAYAAMQAEGYGAERVIIQAYADVRYSGQAYELTVLTDHKKPSLASMQRDFSDEHGRTYGHKSYTDPVDVVSIKIVATARTNAAMEGLTLNLKSGLKGSDSRQVCFGPDFGTLNTPILARKDLDLKGRKGPVIIEEYDSTCVVPPFCHVALDTVGNIVLKLEDNV